MMQYRRQYQSREERWLPLSNRKSFFSRLLQRSEEVGNENNIKDYTLQAYRYKDKCKSGDGYIPVGSTDVWKFNNPKRYIILTKNSLKEKKVSFGK